jgi:phosphomannomutase
MSNTKMQKSSYQIKFGTDGWREIIADNYTVENVKKVAAATAKWLKKQPNTKNKVVIGFDCRFGGEMFAKATAEIFNNFGIDVLISEDFVSTPMVSLYTLHAEADLGIVITASHNPPAYNGYKIKGSFGGPAFPKHISEIETLISEDWETDNTKKGTTSIAPIEQLYMDTVKKQFDIEAISKLTFAYDAMYGAGQNVIKKLFPKAHLLHCTYNPSFEGRAPEPIAKNLPELAALIKNTPEIGSGLATDGDADRIGFYDENGEFVDSHHLILLLTKYLVEHKKLGGTIVKSFSVSNKIEKMCQHYNLESLTTKIGFKYICEHMVNGDVLVGAEESGGIAIKSHIPERDGIWMALVIWEFMAKTGKSVSQLVNDVYAITGPFAVERYDLHVSDADKARVIESCKNDTISNIGTYTINQKEDIDGYKFHTSTGEWVMIRPSGTEPVLRVYAEAANQTASFALLDETCKHFGIEK